MTDTVWVEGDRVQQTVKYDGVAVTTRGTVAKYIGANGKYFPMVVVDWDGDTRRTVHANSVRKEVQL